MFRFASDARIAFCVLLLGTPLTLRGLARGATTPTTRTISRPKVSAVGSAHLNGTVVWTEVTTTPRRMKAVLNRVSIADASVTSMLSTLQTRLDEGFKKAVATHGPGERNVTARARLGRVKFKVRLQQSSQTSPEQLRALLLKSMSAFSPFKEDVNPKEIRESILRQARLRAEAKSLRK